MLAQRSPRDAFARAPTGKANAPRTLSHITLEASMRAIRRINMFSMQRCVAAASLPLRGPRWDGGGGGGAGQCAQPGRLRPCKGAARANPGVV